MDKLVKKIKFDTFIQINKKRRKQCHELIKLTDYFIEVHKNNIIELLNPYVFISNDKKGKSKHIYYENFKTMNDQFPIIQKNTNMSKFLVYAYQG